MKTIIIGGSSALGSALKPVLSELSEVITTGRKDCDIFLDLNLPPEKINLPDIDVVVHTAAHFGGKVDQEILDAEAVNVLGTLKICQAAYRAKCKHFILISSMSACLKSNSEYYSIYALSKKHSEDVAQFYCSHQSLSLTILRPSQIYGNQENFRLHQPFIYVMADKAEKGENISIYGSNDAFRNYIHIDDLTAIIAKVIQKKIVGTFSCMSTSDLRYSQVAKAAHAAFHSKGDVIFLKDKPNIPDNIFEKDNTLYEKIDFFPKISIDEGLKRLAKYRESIK